MEKLGIANEDLLKELKAEYQQAKEVEAELIKVGSRNNSTVEVQLKALKDKIDELEAV